MGPKTKSKKAFKHYPTYSSPTPLEIGKISTACHISTWLKLTVESKLTVTNGSKFVLSDGKKAMINALAFNATVVEKLQGLQERNQYLIKGSITAKPRNRNYPKLPNFRNFDLFLNEIDEIQHVGSQPSTSTQNISNLAEVKKAVIKGKPFLGHLKNVIIESGHIYRYMGCEICTTSIRLPTAKGNYICSKCPKRSGDKQRKVCMIVKNFTLSDGNVKLDELVGFNEFCTELLGKNADSFVHDLKAQGAFRKLIGTAIDVDLTAYKKKNSFTGLQELVIKCGKCVKVPQTEAPDAHNSALEEVYADVNDETLSPLLPTKRLGLLEIQVTKRSRPLNFNKKLPYELANPGLALIINNLNFPHRKLETERKGSEVDFNYLTELLPQLNCDVFEGGHSDIDSKKIGEIISRFQQQLLKNDSSFCIVVILSHGNCNEIEMVDGKRINLWNDVVYKFSIDQFKEFDGRPKIFIIEACQAFSNQSELPSNVKIADVLVVLPSLPGHLAYRKGSSGSQFIRCLTYVLMKSAKGNEIQEMLNSVQMKMVKADKSQLCIWIPILFVDFYFNI